MSAPICFECGSKMNVAHEDWPYRESGLEHVTLAGIEVRRCPSCNAVEPVIPNIVGLHRTLAYAVVRAPDELGDREIDFLLKFIEGTEHQRIEQLARAVTAPLRLAIVPRSVRALAESALRFCVFLALALDERADQPTSAYRLQDVSALIPRRLQQRRHHARSVSAVRVISAARQNWEASATA